MLFHVHDLQHDRVRLRRDLWQLYRARIGIFLRTVARLVRQERTNEFIREQEHQDALDNYRAYRGMILRTMMDGVPGGEWQVEPRRTWPTPLQHPEGEVSDRSLSVQLREGENQEEKFSTQ